MRCCAVTKRRVPATLLGWPDEAKVATIRIELDGVRRAPEYSTSVRLLPGPTFRLDGSGGPNPEAKFAKQRQVALRRERRSRRR
jgi:hypothetical protein